MAENINHFVIDASCVLTLLFPDENESKLAKKYLVLLNDQTHNEFTSPSFLEIEVANAISSAVRSKRIKVQDQQRIFQHFKKFPIHSRQVDVGKVLELATTLKLSVYDAMYAQLATDLHAELLSLDKKLVKKFSEI